MPSVEWCEHDEAIGEVVRGDFTKDASASFDDQANGEPQENKVSQSQDQDDDVVEEEEVEVEANDDQPAAHQVSPMPQKNAPVVTPRPKAPSSSNAKGDSNGSNDPSTPPSKNLPSAAGGAISTTTVGVTPGESGKKKKDNKKQAQADAAAGTKTLHSFFSKVDPSAKKKTGGVKSSSGGSSGGMKIAAKAKSSSTTTATADKKKGKGGKKSTATTADGEVHPNSKATKKSTAKAAAVGNDKAEKKEVPPKNAKGGKKKDASSVDGNSNDNAVTTRPSKKSTKKADVVTTQQNVAAVSPEELDDSPYNALSIASRTVNACGPKKKKRRSGSVGRAAKEKIAEDGIANSNDATDATKEVKDAVVAEGGTVEVEDKPSNVLDSSEDDKVDADVAEMEIVLDDGGAKLPSTTNPPSVATDDKDEEQSNGSADWVEKIITEKDGDKMEDDTPSTASEGDANALSRVLSEQDGDEMDVDESEYITGDARSAKEGNAASDGITDVECEEGTVPALEDTADFENNDGNDTDDDATVSLEEEQSPPLFVSIDEQQPAADNEAPIAKPLPSRSPSPSEARVEDIPRSDSFERSTTSAFTALDSDAQDDEAKQPRDTNDTTDSHEPSGDDEVVAVDNAKDSVTEELPTEGDDGAKESSNEASNDEVAAPRRGAVPRFLREADEQSKEVVDVDQSSKEVVAVDDTSPEASTVKSTEDKKKGAKPKKDPNAPKKNMTALKFYQSAKANRSDVKAANPDAKAADITKILSTNFKALTAEERAPWDEKAAVDKERYQKEMQEYSAKTPAPSSEPAAAATTPKMTPKKKTSVAPEKPKITIAAALKKQAAISPKRSKSTSPKRSGDASSTTTATKPIKATPPPLSEEDASRLRHCTTLREKYVTRATELGERPDSDDFEEESLSLEGAVDLPAVEKGSVEVGEDGQFPDALLTHLLMIVQGRSLPLSALAKQALEELSAYTTDARPLTIESISSKIKLLAERKSYLSGKPPALSEKSTPTHKLDCFENAEECYLWRWELSSIDLLPQKEAAKVKKARTMRKKLQGHHKAIINLITAVDKAMAWLQNGAAKSSTAAASAGEKLIAKVSDMEEKVLKYEREEEKARLLNEAKLQKQKSKSDEKELEKKRKAEEKAQKKLEAAKEREEAKRRKNEEKEQERLKKEQEQLKKQQEEEAKSKKRKARFTGFFSVKKKQKVLSTSTSVDTSANVSSFDGDAFRSLIDSQDEPVASNPFAKPSQRMKVSRRRKTGKVRVSVFVTVLSENAFAPQPYDEERVIIVPNKYKFLGFHEDIRPPYHGTWRKKSSIVTGRRPMAKDTKFLDYDNDSEEEWEEGDDEEGEDLQDDDRSAEDELQNEEDNDGWLAAEDDLGTDDEEDDETRELRKRKNGLAERPSHFKACVVAPRMGGLTHERFTDDDMECIIEGFATPKDAMDALTSHAGCIVTPDVSICLDAFPPSDPTKETNQTKKDGASGSKSPPRPNKEMSVEAQAIMAKFVHNSTLKSKDHVITELLRTHSSVTNSRAQAMRELDVMADKRRLANGGGVVWEVKADQLKKLGLKEEDLKQPPAEPSPQKSSDGGDKKAKEKDVQPKDPNAPKKNATAAKFYAKANRSDVKAANPDAKVADINKILSANFKALTEEERGPWDEKAATDKERYQKEMKEYAAKAPSSDKVSTSADNVVATSPKPTTSPKPADGEAKKPSSAKKRKKPDVPSAASVNLMSKFVAKKKSKKE